MTLYRACSGKGRRSYCNEHTDFNVKAGITLRPFGIKGQAKNSQIFSIFLCLNLQFWNQKLGLVGTNNFLPGVTKGGGGWGHCNEKLYKCKCINKNK